jgi:disulfide bond formation protein DsbB
MLTKNQNSNRLLLAGLGSGAMLMGAFFFQAVGYAPCTLCVLQRWPHAIAAFLGCYISIGVLIHHNEYPGSARPGHLEIGTAILGSIAMLTSIALAMTHVGVELHLWASPTACGQDSVQALIGKSENTSLLAFDPNHVPSCSTPIWQFMGLSMAAWNAIFSIMLATLWISTLVRRVLPEPQPIDEYQQKDKDLHSRS